MTERRTQRRPLSLAARIVAGTLVIPLSHAGTAGAQDQFRTADQRQSVGEQGYTWIGPKSGVWWCTFDTPGGPLGFTMDIRHLGANRFEAAIRNGTERIPVDLYADSEEQTFVIDIPHYNATITGFVDATGTTMQGDYIRPYGEDDRFMTLTARLTTSTSYTLDAVDENISFPTDILQRAYNNPLAERWTIDFAQDEDPAVGVFHTLPDGINVSGTIITPTGDYRYLTGVWDGARLRLSTFDGAHAFLFDATLQGNRLVGDFWSGNHYHDTWTATPDPDATVPNGFGATNFTQPDWDALVFPDLEGNQTSLASFVGKPMIVEIMGSWCPNCHDAAKELKRLKSVYGDEIEVVCLAFESLGDFGQDAELVRRYAERHDLSPDEITFLVAGLKDEDEATAALGFLDKVRAFPTTIFVDAQGTITAVHTGFAGPATGVEHERQVIAFSEIIGSLVE